MLKHTHPHIIKLLTILFNSCLNSTDIPTAWKQSKIYPISKKPFFTDQLNHTRPITLLEHIRKIFTKIITNWLSKTMSKYFILDLHNFVALPYSSTTQPIHILTNILQEVQTQNKELWLLSQDIGKAYDSVHIPLLQQ